MRSSWAMTRSVTIDGRGQPAGQCLTQDVGVGGHERGVGVQPPDERLEALRGVDRLEGCQLRQELLGAAHLVDDPQLVQAVVVLLDPELADDLEHVAGDPLLGRQPIDRDGCRLGRRPLHERACPGAPLWRRILEPVGVARIAIEGRGRRVEFEDAFPESVGKVVHGGGRVGHEGSLTTAIDRRVGRQG